MLRFVMLFLCFPAALLASDVKAISQFDGKTTPHIGPFGEQVPDSFYGRDFTEAFNNRLNFGGSFSLEMNKTKGGLLHAFVINESKDDNDVVICAVGRNRAKNFIVKVPGSGYMALDLKPLYGFDRVMIMSMQPFGVQFDGLTDALGRKVEQLEILTPLEQQESASSSLAGCGDDTGFYRVKISNRTPSQPGYVYARAVINVNFVFQTYFMNIQYPIGGANFHQAADPRPSCYSSNPDFYTNSVTGRYLKWKNMIAQLSPGSFVSGVAYCEAPLSETDPNSCYVTVPNPANPSEWIFYQPLEAASWSARKSN